MAKNTRNPRGADNIQVSKQRAARLQPVPGSGTTKKEPGKESPRSASNYADAANRMVGNK